MITAAGIKKILYAETSVVTADLTPVSLKAIIAAAKTAKDEVLNVHGDTWTLEEAEASVTGYKNALTGQKYRQDVEMGDITANFTIGQYEYQQKANLMGGEVTKKGGAGSDKDSAIGWKRAQGVVEKYKCMMFLTKDDQWCVFPKAQVIARESNTDKAVGLAVKAIALEPNNKDVSSEYWFDGEEVENASEVG